MATLTKEQVEQKLQQLKQLAEEANALTKELAEAGVLELSEEDLEQVAGGNVPPKRSSSKDQPRSRPKSFDFFSPHAPDDKPFPTVKLD